LTLNTCNATINKRGVIIMNIRVPFSSKIDSELKEKLKELSLKTRIPQAKLIDEAFEDLIRKYNFEKTDKEE
jgi:predicted DNA-binding protein